MTDNHERFGRNIDDAYEGGYSDAERAFAEDLKELQQLRRERAVVLRFLDTDELGTERQGLLNALTALSNPGGGGDRV